MPRMIISPLFIRQGQMLYRHLSRGYERASIAAVIALRDAISAPAIGRYSPLIKALRYGLLNTFRFDASLADEPPQVSKAPQLGVIRRVATLRSRPYGSSSISEMPADEARVSSSSTPRD